MNINENTYIDLAYHYSIGPGQKEIPITVNKDQFKQVFQKNCSIDTIEKVADALLPLLNPGASTSASKRYKFKNNLQANKRDLLLKAIFERCLSKDAPQFIDAAEKADQTKQKFYPIWKDVCWIQAPQVVGEVVGSEFCKAVFTIIGISICVKSAYTVYQATSEFYELAIKKAIPLIINNTPLEVIRVANSVAKVISNIFNNPFRTFFTVWATKQIILLGPEVPYLTNAVKSINTDLIYSMLFSSPQTVLGTGIEVALETIKWINKTCNDLNEIMQSIAETSKLEKQNICKHKATLVWQKICEENTPLALMPAAAA